MRKLLTTAVLILAVLLAVDRGGAYATSQVLASKIQSQQHLSSKPSVVIHGFPFLTQVAGGSYDRVDLDARGVVTPDLRLDRLHIEAEGITIALSDLIHGTVREVPVARGFATLHLSFADLNAAIARQVGNIPSVSSTAAGQLTVTGTVGLFGLHAKASADADVSVTDDSLSFLPEPRFFDVLPSVLRGPAQTALTVHLRLPDLPFGIELASATVSPKGVDVMAEVSGVVFPVEH